MQDRTLSVLLAGGGTGGHLFPAIAIAAEIKRLRPDTRITFAGTRKKIEARIVPQHGYDFSPIWISGFTRRFSVGNLLFPFKVVVALMQSCTLIRKCRPDVVIGTGGYVAGPVVSMASALGIPTIIQEQNSYPGVTTRLLASHVDEVHVTFETSLQYLSRKDNVRVTGNPTRESVGSISRKEGRLFFHLDGGKKTLLVFGGSLGAGSINRAILDCIADLVNEGVQVIWQTGPEDHGALAAGVASGRIATEEAVRIYSFIEKMEYAYGACDLAVCRSGATTLAELTRGGVPSILVPYPHAAADHQTENARAMVDAGAAVMLTDEEIHTKLASTVRALMSNDQLLSRMAERSRSLARPDAAGDLAKAVLALAEKRNGGRGTGI